MTTTITPTDQELFPGYYVYVNVFKDFYEIGAVEPFQYTTGDESTAFFSAVAVSGSAGFKNITEIEPDDKPNRNLFQAIPGVRYDFKYYFKVPSGTNRFGTDVTKSIGFLDPFLSPFYNPNKNYEMWFAKNFYPSIDASNQSAEVLTPQVRFTGFKYQLKDVDDRMREKLKNRQVPFRTIIVGGLP
ncbi:MAG: hypothetical protein Q7R52_02785 [archaeon]|nr:hypothetical protein [archaeon]